MGIAFRGISVRSKEFRKPIGRSETSYGKALLTNTTVKKLAFIKKPFETI